MTFWRDAQWWNEQSRDPADYHYQLRPIRSRRGRFTRWEDQLENFMKGQQLMSWKKAAKDADLWKRLEREFVFNCKV